MLRHMCFLSYCDGSSLKKNGYQIHSPSKSLQISLSKCLGSVIFQSFGCLKHGSKIKPAGHRFCSWNPKNGETKILV